MKKKAFNPEYMTKRRPHVPRCLCSTWMDWLMGKMSPSKVFFAMSDEEKGRKLAEYQENQKKYRCWKRQMSQEEWKALYRWCRRERPPVD